MGMRGGLTGLYRPIRQLSVILLCGGPEIKVGNPFPSLLRGIHSKGREKGKFKAKNRLAYLLDKTKQFFIGYWILLKGLNFYSGPFLCPKPK
jgi:hypothetical protein